MFTTYTWEHNGNDSLIYFDDFPGAYVRGKTKAAALQKSAQELRSYLLWRYGANPGELPQYLPGGEYETHLQVSDADSDVLPECEKPKLTQEEYHVLKQLTLRSARCFQILYDSIPDKQLPLRPHRKTFYGFVPATAEEMYQHTKNVNAYYFNQIGIDVGNEPDILSCRKEGFSMVESLPDYLQNRVFEGDYDELWSLRKVFRRFLWHDRIHAKALYRHALNRFDPDLIQNPFCF